MRLTLEPLTRAAAADVVAATPGARRWAEGYPTEGDLDVARMVLAMPSEPEEPWYGPLTLLLDGVAVGGAGFFGPPDADGVLRCGYGVAAPLRGQGLATEAVLALLAHARTDPRARAVRADALLDNVASHRVLEKTGFGRVEGDWVAPGHVGFLHPLGSAVAG